MVVHNGDVEAFRETVVIDAKTILVDFVKRKAVASLYQLVVPHATDDTILLVFYLEPRYRLQAILFNKTRQSLITI